MSPSETTALAVAIITLATELLRRGRERRRRRAGKLRTRHADRNGRP